ncbi:hypothetical protein [Lysinibacillus sp. Bpr_S20]|uniref:hypothetical protein n=1 Tax=Lysinibacillus sp. Bpr_S20 TaxID=2933964 RepID=UPI002010C779|nr:hypothetical protein [Lysinibacillus sp. Bpr_S20]MCL1700737.1 hypothetical protein [Lysinibacillus sp. Bpr_S20]
MKIKGHIYTKATEHANLISTITSQMALADLLEKGKHLNDTNILVEYERKELVGIKDSIAQIWASLELHNVKGHLDHVFEHKGNKVK